MYSTDYANLSVTVNTQQYAYLAVAQLPPPQQQTAGVLEFVKQQIEINKTLANLMLKKEQHMVEQNSLMKQMINDKAEYYGKSGKQSQLVYENSMHDQMEIHICADIDGTLR
ncbi:unnamed protein product [Rotaria magnacalcarata]|uniref:Uncharacterized protein n=2 Tax=Rotaria magnacalcarata TaxID=392030 RepID=A0A8S2QW29_9BILA|nr:unnamed protein product [Rotaria magnacalcarata]